MRIPEIKVVSELAARLGITRTESELFVLAFQEYVSEQLRQNHSVLLHGFGKFYVSHREPRIGINPRTKVKITIPSVRVASFKAGEKLKRIIN